MLGIDEATYKGHLSLHLFHFTVELNFLNYRIFEGNEKQRNPVSSSFLDNNVT